MTYSASQFKHDLAPVFHNLHRQVSLANSDWTVRGFIDAYCRIYTISVDTKVLSKIIELMLFPVLEQFAARQHLAVELAAHQNHYPDLTLTASGNARFALDINRNIGSITAISALINGEGPFTTLGKDVFDDYWMYYLTNEMATAAELPRPPYRNLEEYLRYRGFTRP